MPARENLLERLIRQVLRKNPGHGSTELYEDVSSLYCKIKGRRNKLSKSLFYTHLNLMIDKGLVDKRGGNTKGKKVEHYLTEIGDKQTYQHSLDMPTRTNKIQLSITEDNIPEELKALYAIILYFNQGVWYTVHTEDALEYILRQFGLSIASLIKSEGTGRSEIDGMEQIIFRSPKQDATVYKDVFLRSNIHEIGTIQYRCSLRGITCEAILENRELRVFKYLGFTPEDIRGAIGSLCSLNILKPMGSLGLTIANEVIYKIDKSIFDFMAGLDIFQDDNYLFSKIESIMIEIWSNFRPRTDDEKKWLYFLYGNKEADRLINSAYESRIKITGGQAMNSYIRKTRRDNKMELDKINKRVDVINEKITEIVNCMEEVQELYRITVDRHKSLVKNIFEIIFPDFFVDLHISRFGLKN